MLFSEFLFSLNLFLKTVLREQCQTPLLVFKEQFSVFKNKKLFFSYDAKHALYLQDGVELKEIVIVMNSAIK